MLFRRRGYAIINILGLTLGITSSIVIYVCLKYELSFDAFHSKAAQTYRIVQHNHTADGVQYWNTTAYPLAEALRHDFPELEVTQTAGPVSRIISSEDEQGAVNRFEEDKILFVDAYYLRIFDFQGLYPRGKHDLWLEGNPQTAFENPNSVILTQKLAKRYFQNAVAQREPLLGKTIKLNNKDELMVTGIIKDPPKNTSLLFEMLIPYQFFKQNNPYNAGNWSGNYQGTTYVTLPKGYDPKVLEEEIISFKKKYLKPEDDQRIEYLLQPLKEIHTETLYGSSPGSYVVGSKTLWALACMAVFLVVIACVNFINLATAQATKRSKEIGVRKVLGGTRIQLWKQFIGETLILTLVAMLISLLVTDWILLQLNDWLSIISLDLSLDGTIVFFCIVLMLIVTLLAGLYPALVLSAYTPILALKHKMTNGSKGGFTLRRALIVLQFSIVQLLIVGTIVVANQMHYIQNKDLGFTKEAIVTINIAEQQADKLEAFRQRLLQHPNIIDLSYASGTPTTTTRQYGTDFRLHWEPVEMMREAEMKVVDLNYLRMYDLQLIAGEWLTEANKIDGFNGFVVNEILVKMLNLKPEEAIGKSIIINEGEAPIVGVVKDFHNNALQEEITSCLLFYWGTGFLDEASVQLYSGAGKSLDLHKTLDFIEKAWKEFFPTGIYKYEFLDDYLARNYLIESLIYGAFKMFSAIAIFIGCLGLYGLVSFMAETRIKEIGIRKVLGASVSSIVSLLSKDFFKLVLVALVIASPIAWYLMQQWLQGFAYRIEITWWIFALSGGLALLIALLTVSYQSIKAAMANPINSLRNE